ncbi:hypothetical protein J6590_091453, partial [Homalodisca vitripennis]
MRLPSYNSQYHRRIPDCVSLFLGSAKLTHQTLQADLYKTARISRYRFLHGLQMSGVSTADSLDTPIRATAKYEKKSTGRSCYR